MILQCGHSARSSPFSLAIQDDADLDEEESSDNDDEAATSDDNDDNAGIDFTMH